MGLPMWTHSPEAKDALKVDLVAAAARSPIRRRSLGTRARSIRSPRSPDFQRPAHVEATTRRSRLPPPPAPESPARDYTRFSSFRDTPGVAPDEEHLMRLRRERYYRNLYDTGVPGFGEVTHFSSSRGLPALTASFAPATGWRNARPERVSHARERSSFRSRSPYRRASARSRSPWADAAPSTRSDHVVIIEDGDFEEGQSAPVNLPPLRRMGRRTIADGPLPSSSLRESWSPSTTIDGLGDRDRSVSPADDPWDTMLSTVAPDPLPPTADSSFTSAAASASFSNSHPSSRAGSSNSNSNSAASSRTHVTIPSRRQSTTELFYRACESSEDDTASDTEEEDIEPRLNLTSMRRRSRHLHTMEQPPPRNLHRQSHGLIERTREANAFVRNVLSERASRDSAPPTDHPNAFQLDGPTEELTRPTAPQVDGPIEESGHASADMDPADLDQELSEARAILEQLRRRGDVPDNFWASVGLMRSIS
ncbi:hypothetical protein P154DRAFT_544395 [Amniculicola lignicola CBS 123094]|uniref:Uncharacterized protein n=1 Tax=Amniculicola lignicola CBS 123094 TaxID=1392246 RepID=A0A6A5WRD7_9PLEO|nr:hypothetical protein P154DRAFT_544395 [Amniculicola lignicola CBS 123094]